MQELQASDSLAALLLAHPRISSGELLPTRKKTHAGRIIGERESTGPLHFDTSNQMIAHRKTIRHSSPDMMANVAPGANVVIFGAGAVQYLTARLAAIRGFKTSLLVAGGTTEEAEQLCYDTKYAQGSIPLTMVPIQGESADEALVNATIESADAIIIAFDGQADILGEKQLNILMPSNSKAKHISVLSRSLNGEGMGFWGSAARVASNADVWSAPDVLVETYKNMEAIVKARAAENGASYTIARVGTLKGGAAGSSASDDNGESSFLNTAYYTMGQQDVVNWRLLYDNSALGVEILRGDKLKGPGIRAVWDSRDSVGEGDTHRGAAASALVESLQTPAAQNADFSIKTTEGRKFPTPEEMASLYEKA